MLLQAKINSISISDTTVEYRDLALTCDKGELICLTGDNGAGKTLLLNSLAGIIPYINRLGGIDGNIWYEGNLISQDTFENIRKRIGFIAENPASNLLFSHVFDEVSIDLQLSGVESKEARNRAKEALLTMQLPESYWNRNIGELSAGEAQKVSLANILARKSPVLFLDEPTQCLDKTSRSIFIENINKIKNDSAIIIASQDQGVISFADRVILVESKNSTKTPSTKSKHGKKLLNVVNEIDFIPQPSTTLEIKNLVIGYRHSGWKLPPLNITAKSGTAIWLKGGNGSGKTTLLATIAGLIKPFSGQIKLNGVSSRNQKKRKTLSQHPPTLTFLFSSVEQELALLDGDDECGRLAGKNARKMWSAFVDHNSLNSDPRQLSYGQKKILNILSRDPCVDLMLFDEPSVGLDTTNLTSIVLLMRRLLSSGRIIIFSSHDAKFAESIATTSFNIEKII